MTDPRKERPRLTRGKARCGAVRARFGAAYADQNERNHQALVDAIALGAGLLAAAGIAALAGLS